MVRDEGTSNASEPDDVLEGPPEEGPADEGQHPAAGADPKDVGVEVDEEDAPLAEGPDLPEQDKLHVAMSIALDRGLRISSTTGPGHTASSYHYRRPYRNLVIKGRRYEVGRAADIAQYGNPDGKYRQYFKAVEYLRPTEMFYDPMGYFWKNGQKYKGAIGDHRDHVHVAF